MLAHTTMRSTTTPDAPTGPNVYYSRPLTAPQSVPFAVVVVSQRHLGIHRRPSNAAFEPRWLA